MTDKKAFAAQSFATWLKKYDTFDTRNDEAFEALILCAAHALSSQSEDGVFTEDEMVDFIKAFQNALAVEASISLLREGRVVPGVMNGELAFGPID